MTEFETRTLPAQPDATAPDGSDVRLLAGLGRASAIHVSLGPGEVSVAVAHRTVEEIWFFLSGRGEMWRRQGEREEVVSVAPGTSCSIPLGTCFQFRASSDEPLEAVATTVPAWPGDGEACEVSGPWTPTQRRTP